MEKKIIFDGKETTFKTSGVTVVLYKKCFREDLILEVVRFRKSAKNLKIDKEEEEQSEDQIVMGLEFLEIVRKLAYILYLEANDKDIINKINYESYLAWLMKLSPNAFDDKDVNMEIFNLWNMSTQGTSTPKN